MRSMVASSATPSAFSAPARPGTRNASVSELIGAAAASASRCTVRRDSAPITALCARTPGAVANARGAPGTKGDCDTAALPLPLPTPPLAGARLSPLDPLTFGTAARHGPSKRSASHCCSAMSPENTPAHAQQTAGEHPSQAKAARSAARPLPRQAARPQLRARLCAERTQAAHPRAAPCAHGSATRAQSQCRMYRLSKPTPLARLAAAPDRPYFHIRCDQHTHTIKPCLHLCSATCSATGAHT